MRVPLLYPISCAALALGAPTLAMGQEARHVPPPVVQIYIEHVKTGQGAAHTANEAAWAKAFAGSPARWIGMMSLSGTDEAWYLSGYGSMDDWEQTMTAVNKVPALNRADSMYGARDAAFVDGTRSVVAVYRPDLSWKAESVAMPSMRYVQVLTIRARQGREREIEDVAKTFAAAYNAAPGGLPWAMYQVMFGMPQPTFLLFFPSASLKDIDADMAHSGAVMNAMSDVAATMAKFAEGAQASQTDLFRFSPKMSNPPQNFVEADPDFWKQP